MLDAAGLRNVRIFASSGLDEYMIQALVASGAPIDAFGVGTKLAVMAGASELDMAYKLVEYAGKGRLKLSTRKVLYPGRKQVFRKIENGRMARDLIGRFDEQLPGEPLLRPLIVRGEPVACIDLHESRRHLREEMESLPEALRIVEPSAPYPVAVSDRLQSDFHNVCQHLR
jgi:nicotinate phosphoribosyltransferase